MASQPLCSSAPRSCKGPLKGAGGRGWLMMSRVWPPSMSLTQPWGLAQTDTAQLIAVMTRARSQQGGNNKNQEPMSLLGPTPI